MSNTENAAQTENETESGLVVLNNTELVQQGGLGINLSSKLFQTRPSTINIVQPNSQAEGAIKGNLRVSETGDQYKTMRVVLLLEPAEQRQYYIGEKDQMNRTPDNLMCFSRDMKKPDLQAKDPQAYNCASCPRQDWDKWRTAKDKGVSGAELKALQPSCDSFYRVLMIDTNFQIPLQMFVRSKSKKPFEKGMEQFANTVLKMRSQGLNPNIFDISFTLSTKLETVGKFSSYVLQCSDFKAITDEEREKFGDIYLKYINRGKSNDDAEQAEAEAEASQDSIDQVNKSIDNAVIDPEYLDATGAITI